MTERPAARSAADEADEAAATDDPSHGPARPVELVGGLVVSVIVGGGLAYAGHDSALALLVAVAVVQALTGVTWLWSTGLPGRRGAVVIGALAAAGADVTASLFPHGRLGALLVVFGLAVPAMFVHQLARGTARTRLVASLSSAAVLVALLVAPAALLQLRHELVVAAQGGQVVAAAVAAIAAAVAAGCLVDLVLPVPRFDPAVPRGLLAVVVSAAVGAVVAGRLLGSLAQFPGGRGEFVGAALGALGGLISMAGSFVVHDHVGTHRDEPVSRGAGLADALRPALPGLVALTLLSPAAYLLCLALRT